MSTCSVFARRSVACRPVGLLPAVLVLLLALAPLQAFAQPIPELTGRVVDNAGILAPTTENILNQQLRQHEDSTGNQVAVLTIESLEGYAIEDYSIAVAREWALGTEEFDNGVLLIIAVQDRRMRIEVGFGLEGVLPDATADRIIRHEMKPKFRDGDFDAGVRSGVSAILEAIEGTYEPPPTSSSGVPTRVGGLFALILGAVLGLLPGYLILTGTAKNGVGCAIIGLIFVGVMPLAATIAFFAGLGMLFFGESVLVLIPIAIGVPLAVGAFIWHMVMIIRSDEVKAARDRFQEGETIKEGIQIGWLYLPASMWTKSQTVGSGGSFSSGGFSSGGSSFGGGGGFSGGGGSFGGGGASGSW